MPRIINDVTLRVADLSRSLQFYVDLVGLRKLDQTDAMARLGVPGSEDPSTTLQHYPGVLFISSHGYHHHMGLNV